MNVLGGVIVMLLFTIGVGLVLTNPLSYHKKRIKKNFWAKRLAPKKERKKTQTIQTGLPPQEAPLPLQRSALKKKRQHFRNTQLLWGGPITQERFCAGGQCYWPKGIQGQRHHA